MSVPTSAYLSPVWCDGIFDNKVVFCTGGGGTICSQQVRALVHLGANACIIGRNADKTTDMAASLSTARKGAKVIGLGDIDVRKLESLEKAVATCVAELGSIDFVIAGAAGNFLAPLSSLSSNAFRAVQEIDVLGSYHTFKATAPHLVASAEKGLGGGRIIFVSATLHYNGTPFQTHVAVAKAGVDALSAQIAIEYGPRGVTSNVIAPGGIEGTEGLERLATEEMRKGEGGVRSKVPLGRWGRTREIADASTYLFSPAGDYVNGTTIVVDGGAWRIGSNIGGSGFEYPDALLKGGEVRGVKTGRKEKAKL